MHLDVMRNVLWALGCHFIAGEFLIVSKGTGSLPRKPEAKECAFCLSGQRIEKRAI